MNTINIQDTALTVRVTKHDSSTTGIRYKLVVTLPKRLPQRRRPSMMMALYGPKPKRPTKPKPDPIGPWVLDIGNALYRQLGFEYCQNPSVGFGRGVTEFTYYFNCTDTARRLGLPMEEFQYSIAKRHEDLMVSEGWCPNFQAPYLYRRVE